MRGHFRAGGFDRRSGLETAEQLRHPMRAHGDHRRAHVMRAGHHVRDDLGVGGIRHRRLEHADHGRAALAPSWMVLPTTDGSLLSDVLPETIREHRDAGGVQAFIGRLDQPADHRPQAHHVEVMAVDDARLDDARLAQTDQREFDGGEFSERFDRWWRARGCP